MISRLPPGYNAATIALRLPPGDRHVSHAPRGMLASSVISTILSNSPVRASARGGIEQMETKGMSRRDLFRFTVAGGVTAAVGLNLGEGGPRAATADDTSTPDGALQALVDGNARFLAHNMTSLNEDQNLINSGIPESHQPFATILSCADARLSPEIIFDQVMGDLFITRVAGNVATPEIIASLEYAVAALNVRLIMVLGHGACGAVTATDRRTVVEKTQISALYAPLRVAVETAGQGASFDGQAP